MALQVWLPLNGNIKNQGLLDDLGSSGIVNYQTSDFGSSLFTSGRVYMDELQAEKVLNNRELTICFWIYVLPDSGSTDLRGMLFGNNDMGTGNNRKFSLFQYPTCNDFHYSLMNDAASTTFAAGIVGGVLTSHKWTHVAFVYDNPSIKVYINGVLKHTDSGVSNSSSFRYGTTVIHSISTECRLLSDYRIYDNALSDREIYEIYKGLVVHYQLNDPLVTRSANRYSGEIAAGKCTHGYFSPTKLTSERGYNYKLNYTGNGNNTWPSIGFPAISYEVGKTYDYSCKVRVNSNSNCWPALRAARSCNDWSTNTVGIFSASNYGKWVEFHVRQTMNGTTYLRSGTDDKPTTAPELEIYFNSLSGNGTVYSCDFDIKDVQICEATTSVDFSDGAFNDGVIYDCSGYGRNAKVSGSILTEVGSPRNDYAYNFNQSGYIYNDSLGLKLHQFTIAYWAKIPSTITAQHFICGTFNSWTNNGFGAWRDNNTNHYNALMKSDAESSYGSFTSLSGAIPYNTWFHVAYVYTGSQIKTYLNGNLADTKTYGSNGTCTMPNVYLGNSLYGNRTTENDQSSMSDFRLYATALSDKDIKELYKAPITLTNTGALMTQGEFKEV